MSPRIASRCSFISLSLLFFAVSNNVIGAENFFLIAHDDMPDTIYGYNVYRWREKVSDDFAVSWDIGVNQARHR